MKNLFKSILLKLNNEALACITMLIVLLIVSLFLFGKGYAFILFIFICTSPLLIKFIVNPLSKVFETIRIKVGIPEENNGS